MNLQKYLRRILPAVIVITLLTCKDEEVVTRSYPSIDTDEVTEINENGATLNAAILNIGSSGVIDHGFVYSNFSSPTLNGSDKISLGESLEKGSFSTLANRNLTKNKKYYVRAYAISKANNFIVYGQEVEFVSLGSSVPEIFNFELKEGTIGDTVIIKGSGFSNVKLNNVVFFGTAVSQIIKATSDSLWCEVPPNTVVGENEISLTVGQATIKPTQKFSLKQIGITSLLPVDVSFGDTIQIKGDNFPQIKNYITANVLDKNALVIASSRNEIRVVVSNAVAIADAPVSLKIGVQEILSSESIKLIKPIISDFLPVKGTKDTEVVINGNYFNPIPANNKVLLNGINLSVIQAGKTTLKVKVPSGISPGEYPISLNVATHQINSETNFEIVKPLITAVSPLMATWGNTLTISGENFGTGLNDNVVLFGEIEGVIISASSTELKVKVPNNLLINSSILSVRAKTIDNQIVTFSEPFILSAPVITNFTPIEGKSKSQVTINGLNFNPVPLNQTVMFGDRVAEIISSSSNQLIVKLPTSLIDSDVQIKIEIAEQEVISTNLFHLVSPWRRIASLPGLPRYDATAFAIGNYGYVGAGYRDFDGPNSSKKFWRYDPTLDIWNEIAGYAFLGEGTTSPFVNMIAIVNGSTAFVGLGSQGGWPQWPEYRIRKYDPNTNSWSDAAAIGSRTDGAVAYSANGKGYVATGRELDNSTTSKMWEYNPGLDTWNRKTDLPGAPRWESAGFSLNTKLYLIGGVPCVNCSFSTKDVWEYDIPSDKWKQLKDFPGVSNRSTGFSINDEGYMIAGEVHTPSVGSHFVKEFWKYNPSIDSWTQMEDFPGGGRTAAAVFVIGNKAYFGTGLQDTGYAYDFWEFDRSKL